jgi:hypothetical protein
MANETFDPERVVDAMAPMLGFDIGPEARAAVILHLELTARIAAPLVAFELPDEVDAAPVYRP